MLPVTIDTPANRKFMQANADTSTWTKPHVFAECAVQWSESLLRQYHPQQYEELRQLRQQADTSKTTAPATAVTSSLSQQHPDPQSGALYEFITTNDETRINVITGY